MCVWGGAWSIPYLYSSGAAGAVRHGYPIRVDGVTGVSGLTRFFGLAKWAITASVGSWGAGYWRVFVVQVWGMGLEEQVSCGDDG